MRVCRIEFEGNAPQVRWYRVGEPFAWDQTATFFPEDGGQSHIGMLSFICGYHRTETLAIQGAMRSVARQCRIAARQVGDDMLKLERLIHMEAKANGDNGNGDGKDDGAQERGSAPRDGAGLLQAGGGAGRSRTPDGSEGGDSGGKVPAGAGGAEEGRVRLTGNPFLAALRRKGDVF